MLVCLPTHSRDLPDLARLLRWIARLGECKQHDALIVADCGSPFDQVMNVREQAGQIFRSAKVVTNNQSVIGWPDGCYSLFTTALKNVTQPFLIVEPDAVPLRPGWLDSIESEYQRCGQLFMGYIYPCDQPGLPSQLMSGIAVYPANAIEYLPPEPRPVHWDVQGAPAMVHNGVHTNLIYHFFGQVGLPPTFVATKNQHSPINAMTLEDIPSDAVLYHRNKDGSLIRLLERKLFPEQFKERLAVCFNVHAGDIGLALLHSQWLRTMAAGKKWNHRAIICHDPSAPVVSLNHFEQNLRHCFTEVESFVYARPGIPQYPACANWAFQNVALHMAKQKSPWFWCESDLVVLRPDWLDQLQNEYDRAGRSWMGPVVQHMMHLQGTSVYPADAATRMPRAMQATSQAFDMEMKEETMHDRHDCGHLIHHVWSILNGQLCPVGGGHVPANATPELLRQIPKSAVASHRWKDQSVVQLLLKGEYRH